MIIYNDIKVNKMIQEKTIKLNKYIQNNGLIRIIDTFWYYIKHWNESVPGSHSSYISHWLFKCFYKILNAINETKIYLPILATETIIINWCNGTRNIPATKVRASPINGTQLNNNDHFPYFKKDLETLFMWFSLKGNHFLFLNFKK